MAMAECVRTCARPPATVPIPASRADSILDHNVLPELRDCIYHDADTHATSGLQQGSVDAFEGNSFYDSTEPAISTYPNPFDSISYSWSSISPCPMLDPSSRPVLTSTPSTGPAQDLFRHKTTLPLLILGYWFQTLSQLPYWWCADRGRIEAAVVEDVLLEAVTSGLGEKEHWEHRAAGFGDEQQLRQQTEEGMEIQNSETDRAMKEAVLEFVAWRRRKGGV